MCQLLHQSPLVATKANTRASRTLLAITRREVRDQVPNTLLVCNTLPPDMDMLHHTEVPFPGGLHPLLSHGQKNIGAQESPIAG